MRSTNSYAPARRSSLFHARPYPVIILSIINSGDAARGLCADTDKAQARRASHHLVKPGDARAQTSKASYFNFHTRAHHYSAERFFKLRRRLRFSFRIES